METSATSSESSAIIRYSAEFNDEEADITYQSVDGVRFRIHAVYLKAHTEGLAPPEGSSLSEIVHLTEPESVLELLFKFIYPNRPPVLELEVEFDRVRCLAEAAEKYQVFPVMSICNLHMHDVLPNHALPILSFALKHDYPNLIDAAAPHVINKPTHDIIQQIPSESYAPWFSYYDEWMKVQRRALTTHLPPSSVQSCTVVSLAGNLSTLQKLDTVSFPNSQWRNAIDSDIQAMPKLSRIAGHLVASEPNQVEVRSETRKDNEVIIESLEGDQHYIDQATLNACSNGLTDPLDDKIKVSEKSSTIDLLLKFIKPVRAPDLRSLSFEDLKDLTYAAEKYSIRPATGICRVFIKRTLPEFPVDIFHYAARHHYLDILDIAAPLVVGSTTSFEGIIRQLPPDCVVAWACYYQKWQDIAKKAVDSAISNNAAYLARSGSYVCDSCRCGKGFLHGHLKSFNDTLMGDPGALRRLNDVSSKHGCISSSLVATVFQKCGEEVEELVKEIPVFSSLL